ncbi:MAG: hypothetical protein WKF81_10550, partial [Thermomicrobiales bacterium]
MHITQLGGLVAISFAMVLSSIGLVDGSRPPVGDDAGGAGCDELFAYRNDVYQVFAEYPAFLDWWAADDSTPIDALQPDVAQILVDEGRGFVTGIEDLDVPAIYADGNVGIAGLYGWFNDLIAWVVLEEGDEPDTNDLSIALESVQTGEEAAAAECAEAIADLDGYVLIDPVGIDAEDVPEDPG